MKRADAKRFADYREGYAELWRVATVREAYRGAVRGSAERVLANKPRYRSVSEQTGVPWYVIALIHKMEGDLSFRKHLHNGDPLTARTRLVPRGRPATGNPPFTWEESAVDALRYDGLDKWRDWSVEGIAYCLEKFNGFGYRRFGIPSPYLWSFTTVYTRGKYVADGKWDANAVSRQSGAMAVLAELVKLDPSIRLAVGEAEPIVPDETEVPDRTPSPSGALARSRTVFGTIVAGVSYVVGKAVDALGLSTGGVVGLLGDVASEATGFLAPLETIMGALGAAVPWLSAVGVGYGLAVVLHARISAHFAAKVG